VSGTWAEGKVWKWFGQDARLTRPHLLRVAFFTGLRPSEQIALRWADLDRLTGPATVQRAITRSKKKGTKTGDERTVEPSARALAAMSRARSWTDLSLRHLRESHCHRLTICQAARKVHLLISGGNL
jgi:integrase